MGLNEADTRAKLIDPSLYQRGWIETYIKREETAGSIEIIGGKARKKGVEQQPKYLGLSRFGCDAVGFLFSTGEPIQVLLFDGNIFLLQRLTDFRGRTQCSRLYSARDVFECLHANLSSCSV